LCTERLTTAVLPVANSPMTRTLNRYSRFCSSLAGGAEGRAAY